MRHQSCSSKFYVLNLIGLNYNDEKQNHNFDIFLLVINRQY